MRKNQWTGLFEPPVIPIKALIFLDIDGVLVNEEACISGERIEDDPSDHGIKFASVPMRYLEAIIEQTDAHIVISSSWRKGDLDYLRRVFKSRGFAYWERIIGETMRGYHFVEKGVHLPIPRGVEIKAWIEAHINYNEGEGFEDKHIPYVIIDDDGDMLLQQKDHFVRTQFKPGLTYQNSQEVLGILFRQMDGILL